MKSLAVSVGILIALQTFAVAQQAAPATVSISTPSPTVKSGSAIRIDITVFNTSDHTIEEYRIPGVDKGRAEAGSAITVTDSNGTVLPRIDDILIRKNGKVFHLPSGSGSMNILPIQPGQSTTDFLIISRLVDLTAPGKYFVTVQHQIVDNGDDKLIDSSPKQLEITVTP